MQLPSKLHVLLFNFLCVLFYLQYFNDHTGRKFYSFASILTAVIAQNSLQALPRRTKAASGLILQPFLELNAYFLSQFPSLQ